jgi:hypothetical protein
MVWKYERHDQNLSTEEAYIRQWQWEKGQKGEQLYTKQYTENKRSSNTNIPKTRDTSSAPEG